jgi:hypothetical protein
MEIISKNVSLCALKLNCVLYEITRHPVLTDCSCLIQCAVKLSHKMFFFMLYKAVKGTPHCVQIGTWLFCYVCYV